MHLWQTLQVHYYRAECTLGVRAFSWYSRMQGRGGGTYENSYHYLFSIGRFCDPVLALDRQNEGVRAGGDAGVADGDIVGGHVTSPPWVYCSLAEP